MTQPLTPDVFEEYALAMYAAQFWDWHLPQAGDDKDQVIQLAMTLMDIEDPVHLARMRLYYPDPLYWERVPRGRFDSILTKLCSVLLSHGKRR